MSAATSLRSHTTDRRESGQESSARSEKSTGSSMQRTSSKRRLEINDHNDIPRRQRSAKRSAISAQRKVSFELDEKKRVKTRVRRIPRHTATNGGQESSLWWSKEELEEIMEREQNVFEVFSKCCTSYVDNVLKLWDQCSPSDNRNNDEQQHVALSDTEIEKIANAPARGMENDVVISLNPASRDRAIKSVIETQRALSKASLKIRTSTMSRRYRHLSRAATEFAKNIADGDAQVAAAILRQ